MKDPFFIIRQEHVDSGEFLPGEIGHYAVRCEPDLVLITPNREAAERVFSGFAHHYGYTYN